MIKHEQFVHYRRLEDDPRSVALRLAANGGVTLFVMPFADSQVAVGVSVCSPLDQFCKVKGRLASEGRIRKLRSRQLILVPAHENFVWVRLDRIASEAWTKVVAMHPLMQARETLLLRGGRSRQLVAPRGVWAYPWLTEAPVGAQVVDASQSDDLDSDE